MKKRFFLILLCVALSFTMRPAVTTVEAYTVNDVVAIGQRAMQFIENLPGTIAEVGSFALKQAEKVANAITSQTLVIQKMLALLAVQQATSLLIGNGADGAIIRDFNSYLYISPQQRAMAQMNTFFNTVSRGRLSSLNYEGVGPNYDAYLVAQARMAIAGQPFTTNLQDIATNPKQMFDGGNMKGLMTYMQCANNVACYTLTSTARYNAEFTKAQEIAKSENVNGFAPKKANGRITQPAAIAQNALLQVDQLGTQLIMNAEGGDAEDDAAAIEQVWIGAGISASARLTNYGISDDAGKEAIRNKNDQFPFSLAYSSKGGLGVNVGGVTLSTGAAKLSGSFNLGNTCVSGGFEVDAQGNTVTDINGKKKTCIPSTSSNISTPKVNVQAPTINTGN